MATGLLFKDLDIPTDINGLYGAAESGSSLVKGKKFTYSSDGTLTNNSNIEISTQQAVKTYADTKSADNTVVHLAGTETITGDKTVTPAITLTGGVKDANVSTSIHIGDGSNTAFNTTNKTIVGSVNEIQGLTPTVNEKAALDDAAIALTALNPVYDTSTATTALGSKANDNTVVHLAGTETITGDKAFTPSITITGGLKDANVSTAIYLGDALNTSFNTTNKTTVGAVNELQALSPTTNEKAALDDAAVALTSANPVYDTTTANAQLAYKNWFHSGLISGGTLSINGGDNTKFDVAAGSGIIMDFTNPENPVKTNVSWITQTALTTPFLATLAGTWVGYSKASAAIITSASDFTTNQLHDDVIRLGRLSHFDNTVITGVYQLPLFCYADLEYLCLGNSFGVTNLQGNGISANGSNLKINKDIGLSFRTGAYVIVDPNNPNYPSTSAVSAVTFIPALRSSVAGRTTLTAATTNLYPEKYDDGTGTLHTVTAGYYTIQTALFFPANGTYTMFMLFGQAQYADFSTAMSALATYSPVIEPDIAGGNIRAFIVIQQGTTDLAAAIAAGTAYISGGSLFGTFGSGGGGGGGGGFTPDHNDLTGLQGGTGSEYYHFTNTEHGYISGVNAQSLLTNASPTFNNLTLSVASIVAAGTTQGTATSITTAIALVTSGSNTQGVILPSTLSAGTTIIVNGYGLANYILVYPHLGGNIDNGDINAATLLLPNRTVGFTLNTGGTNWVTTIDTVTAGAGISISHSDGGLLGITNTGVTSLAGTTDQITASSATGGVTLSLSSTLLLPDATTAKTQNAGDDSTSVATTAYVDGAVGGESFWDKTGTIITTHTLGNSIQLGLPLIPFAASYSISIGADISFGSPVATALGGAVIANIYGSNKLDLTHGDARYLTYDATSNVPLIQTGAIKFMLTPAYSVTPLANQYFVSFSQSEISHNNFCIILHDTIGNLTVALYGSTGLTIISITLGTWSPTAGTEYEFELNFDVTAGATRLFINGTQFGSTQTGTGTRSSAITALAVGQDITNLGTITYFAMRKLMLFPAVQHTTNYTPGYDFNSLNVYGPSNYNGNLNAKEVTFSNGLSDGLNAITGFSTDPTLVEASNTLLSTQLAILNAIVKVKVQAACCTNGNITLSGEQTIDGVVTNGTRVLVPFQNNQIEDGIYISSPSAWARASDANLGVLLTHCLINVVGGYTKAGETFYCVNDDIDIGTTAIVFQEFSNLQIIPNNSNTITPVVLISPQNLDVLKFNGANWVNDPGVQQAKIIYRAKNGNDANNGKNIEHAVASNGQALANAAAQSPTVGNQIAIVDFDGDQEGNMNLTPYIHFFGPNMRLSATSTIQNNSVLAFRDYYYVGGGAAFHFMSGSGAGNSFLKGELLSNGYIVVDANQGTNFVDIDYIIGDATYAINCGAGSTLKVKSLKITGTINVSGLNAVVDLSEVGDISGCTFVTSSNGIIIYPSSYFLSGNSGNISTGKHLQGSIFEASLATSLDATYVASGSAEGAKDANSFIKNGKFNFSGTGAGYLTWSAACLSTMANQFTIRFKYTPRYNGNPAAYSQNLIRLNGTANANYLLLSHYTSGTMYFNLADSSGNGIISNAYMGAWSVTNGVEIEVEIDIDVTNGASRIFLNGTQFGATLTQTGTRSGAMTNIQFGANSSGDLDAFSIRDVVIFPYVVHTANYTAGYTTNGLTTVNQVNAGNLNVDRYSTLGGTSTLNNQLSSSSFFAALSSTITGDYSAAGGSLTASYVGTGIISGGKLVMTNNDNSYIYWSGTNNAGMISRGAIKIKVTPNYSGSPGGSQAFICLGNAVNTDNLLIISHLSNGNLEIAGYDSSGNSNIVIDYVWSPISGREYEIEFNFDAIMSIANVLIDGALVGTQAIAYTRTVGVGQICIGTQPNVPGNYVANFSIRDVELFPSVQHIIAYAPGYSTTAQINYGNTFNYGISNFNGVSNFNGAINANSTSLFGALSTFNAASTFNALATFNSGLNLTARSGGTASTESIYEIASFSATFASAAATGTQTVTVYIINRDNQIWMFIPAIALTGNATSTGTITTTATIPTRFIPANTVLLPVCCNSGTSGTFAWGTVVVGSDASIVINYGPGNATPFPICPGTKTFGIYDTMLEPWYKA